MDKWTNILKLDLISLKESSGIYLDQCYCCDSPGMQIIITLGPAYHWSRMWHTHSIGSVEESDRPGRAQTGPSDEPLHGTFQHIDEAYQHDN